jgi:hypothetical protein
MKLKNLQSNKGNDVPNQFEINVGGTVYFQSYDSIIVKIEDGKTYLDSNYWDYSRTTSKYRNLFLGEDKKRTEKKIKEGIYILTNLN